MSIALMTQAWKMDMPAGRKMVLLALCDNANDEGRCYPSVAVLMQKCSMGERTIQQHVAQMEVDGILKRDMRAGRSTVYNIDPRSLCTPAESAPPQNPHPPPTKSAPPPPQNLRDTPADFAPITIKEPSIESSKKRQGARGTRLTADFVLLAKHAKAANEINPDWTPDEIREIGAMFKDHWIAASGNKACKTDWDATWRNWCRNEKKMGFSSKGKGDGSGWRSNDQATLKECERMGMKPLVGESMYMLRERMTAAKENGGVPPIKGMSRIAAPTEQDAPKSKPDLSAAKALLSANRGLTGATS